MMGMAFWVAGFVFLCTIIWAFICSYACYMSPAGQDDGSALRVLIWGSLISAGIAASHWASLPHLSW